MKHFNPHVNDAAIADMAVVSPRRLELLALLTIPAPQETRPSCPSHPSNTHPSPPCPQDVAPATAPRGDGGDGTVYLPRWIGIVTVVLVSSTTIVTIVNVNPRDTRSLADKRPAGTISATGNAASRAASETDHTF